MTKTKKLKLSKKHKKQLQKYLIPAIFGIGALLIGIFGTRIYINNSRPKNIVWAADKSIKIPLSLRKYLHSRDDCKDYKGKGTYSGVGLWGVFQVSGDKFAKVAYGCSWNLKNYVMIVREKNKWEILSPDEYFAPYKGSSSSGALPYCSQIVKFKINNEIEPFCIDENDNAKTNEIKP